MLCIDTGMNINDKAKWRLAHARYMKTDDWAWVREQVIKRDCRCQICQRLFKASETIWDIHHTSYAHFGAADINEVETCLLLCRNCHRLEHGLPPVDSIEDALERIVGWVE